MSEIELYKTEIEFQYYDIQFHDTVFDLSEIVTAMKIKFISIEADLEKVYIYYIYIYSDDRQPIHHFNPFMPTVPTFAVRETASLGIMGAPRVPPLNPSETIVL